ncbi:hypothetical protein ACE6H2_008774 [Prunus campanulata]
MALPRHRGAFNIGFQLCVATGVLSANLINFGAEKITGGWGWRISLSLAAVPASILTLGALLLPETPNSLIQSSNEHQKAKSMLQRTRGCKDVQAELDDLIKASENSKTIKHPFKKLMQRKYRPQLVVAIAMPFFTQVTGINVISFYAPVLFRTLDLSESMSLYERRHGRHLRDIYINAYGGQTRQKNSVCNWGHSNVCVTTVPLYLSEMAPAKHRGAINNGFQFSVGIGALSANLINYGTEKIKAGWGWRSRSNLRIT